jgi:Zn-dependent protease with chaperone function
MSSLAELVASLPAWVRWGPAVFYPALAVLTIVPLTWLLEIWLIRPFLRLPADAHWSERARVGFPARTRLVSWAVTATLLVAMAWVLWLGRLTPIAIAITPAVAVLLVTSIAVARVGRLVAPRRPRPSARGLVGMLAMGWGAVVVLVVGVAASPPDFSPRTWLQTAAVAALVLAWSAGFPARLAAAVRLFAPAPPHVAEIVARSAARAGIAPPPTSVAELPMANAFALVVARRLVLTRALVEELDPEALEAVIDHEVGHLLEPRGVVLVRVASSLALVPLVLVRPMLGAHGLSGAAALAAGAGVVILASAFLRRRLEHAADAHAHGAHGDVGEPRGVVYARVLERIYELNGIPAVLRGPLGGHPSLYDRMRAAGAEPSFARPEPPPRRLIPLLTCFTLAIGSLLGARIALMWAEVALGERLAVMHVVLATTGGDGNAVEQLGYARYLSGDVEGAALAYAAAAELEPNDAEPLALVARLRMMTGDCRGAVGAAWDASVVADRNGDARDRALVRSIRRELESCEPR